MNIKNSDGSYKKRPALILKQMPKYHDFLICGISSQINQKINEFDYLLDMKNKGFTNSGLLKTSIIRLGFLAVIPKNQIEGKIGIVSREVNQLLLKRLSEFLLS